LSDGDGAPAIEFASPPAVTQPERVLLARWERERITAALRTLPERQRRVFELSHFDGRKYAEIAALLDIPVGTVKSRMSEAVRRLRAALCEAEDADDEGEYPK
jgi:RNA polymerase sigma-70 factor (ECF subfamily)